MLRWISEKIANKLNLAQTAETTDHSVLLALSNPGELGELRLRIAEATFKIDNPERDMLHITTGIDLRGGVEFVCGLYDDRGSKVPADDEVVTILRKRLDARGLTEPQVYRLANGDVQVIIPGGTQADAARTRKVLETTGRLEVAEVVRFFHVAGPYDGNRVRVEEFAIDNSMDRVSTGRFTEVILDARGRWRLTDRSYYPDRGMVYIHAQLKFADRCQPVSSFATARLTGPDVDSAAGTMAEGRRALAITYTTTGGAKNRVFTQSVKDRGPRGQQSGGTGMIAFSLDGVVESSPYIREASGSNSMIDGNFTEEELDSLRNVLKAGSLTVKPVVQSQRVVGPTLGKETVDSGVTSMLDALAIIIVFIIAYYWWRLGVVAVTGLTTCIGLVFVALSVFDATLTLPGLAGLVLTVGMAVDANILIFERIREEFSADKDKKSIIDAGFGRAFLDYF